MNVQIYSTYVISYNCKICIAEMIKILIRNLENIERNLDWTINM